MRGRAVAAAVAVVAVVVLVVAQLTLPAIAEHRLRDRLERTGTVEKVEVHAFPAVKLLWDSADRVVVRMGAARPAPGRLGSLLAQSADTDELDARVGRLRILTLALSDVRLRKRGDRLTGVASVTEPAVSAALPPGLEVRPIGAGGGAIVFQGTADLLGQRVSARAVASARDGKLVLVPDVPFGGFLSLTLFADPRVDVTGVGARPRAGGGFTFTARGRVRG